MTKHDQSTVAAGFVVTVLTMLYVGGLGVLLYAVVRFVKWAWVN
jgi:hypothetical protein